MNKIKKFSVLTLVSSVFSILALIMSHLALTDIYHGDEDLSSEWLVLRMAAIIFIFFIIATIITQVQVLKYKPIKKSGRSRHD